jgi:hypothetical protein
LFAPGGTTPVFVAIHHETTTFVGDVSTDTGRKEIAALAYKIAQSKNFIDKVGKVFNSDLKEKTKAVDAERKAIWDKLEALQAEVRAPLTEWEDAEKARVQKHKDAVSQLESLTRFDGIPTLQQIQSANIMNLELAGRDWEEFLDFAKPIHEANATRFIAMIEDAQKAERDRLELEALRVAKSEQDAKDAAAAQQKAADEERARIEREAADKAQRAAAEAIQAEKDKAAKAEAGRIAAEAKAKLEADAAVQREKDRAAAEQKRLDDEAKARENNRAHHAKVNNEVLLGIKELGIDDEWAKIIVTAIAKGSIPHTKISY